ncbi:MAG: zinc ribbon domain-containing protein [Oscillospiraceae bacterium]
MKRLIWILLGMFTVVVIGVLIAVFMEANMSSNYVMKLVEIGSDNEKTYGPEFAVHEGDIILDKGFSFTVLPGRFDFSKPVSKKLFTNQPEETSERLLRVKELNEDSAVIAILEQNTYIEGNMLVTEETEWIITVAYGKTFSVYAKQQIMDLKGGIMYTFVIEDTSASKAKAQKYCTECGNKLTKSDKFCRQCGTPVG